jgi:membrane associated rhomboid family serine protease
VLAARQIPYRLSPSPEGWTLLVPENALETALAELNIYLRENQNWPPRALPLPERETDVLRHLSPLFLIAIFHNIIDGRLAIPFLGYPDWIQLGNLDDVLVIAGEWWRIITALSLHADGVHLISNLFFGGLFIYLLSLRTGLGWAWLLTLISGASGNLINALIQGDHRAIGASTAVFGALGIISGMSAWLEFTALRRWFLPIASGLALLALFGTGGENTDVGAHIFGYLSGFVGGVAVAKILVRRGDFFARGSSFAALLCWIVVIGAWCRAFI